jgi:hypothetical protein
MYARTAHRRARLGSGDWQRFEEQVTESLGNGRYRIQLRRLGGLGAPVNVTPLVATGATVGTSVGLASTIGVWAGPVGAAAGAIVGIIAGLWSAHNARVKGAKAENQIVGSAVQTWDAGMRAIFQAANSGQITGADAGQLVSQLLQQYWGAVQQAKGMPGVADNSGYGGNCGSYTAGVTQACSPGHPCSKSCTSGCCVGCNDLWPSSLEAIALLNNPKGGSVNICTVYSDKYGLAQRGGYTLTYTPPRASAAGSVGGAAASALSSLTGGLTGGSSVAGIPLWVLLVGGAGAWYFATR